MTTEIGRPRDRGIDDAVLRVTVELLAESSYADLSVDAIAARAGTSKPAIYRRWRGKAHLVHEAVFPRTATTELPDTGSLEGDVREMLRRTLTVLSTPAALAALPGLVGEMASDPTLHTALLERFGDVLVGALTDYETGSFLTPSVPGTPAPPSLSAASAAAEMASSPPTKNSTSMPAFSACS